MVVSVGVVHAPITSGNRLGPARQGKSRSLTLVPYCLLTAGTEFGKRIVANQPARQASLFLHNRWGPINNAYHGEPFQV